MINCKSMLQLIYDIRNKLDELEKRMIKTDNEKLFPSCFISLPIPYVDLSNGTNEDKMQRIVEQIKEFNINIIPTAEDSNYVRSALVAELGKNGLKHWLTIRKFREDYDENQQIKRYNNMLKYKDNNTMTFGTIVNRYRQAIDLYNVNNRNQTINN